MFWFEYREERSTSCDIPLLFLFCHTILFKQKKLFIYLRIATLLWMLPCLERCCCWLRNFEEMYLSRIAKTNQIFSIVSFYYLLMSLRFRKIWKINNVGRTSRGFNDCQIGNRSPDANTSVNPGPCCSKSVQIQRE